MHGQLVPVPIEIFHPERHQLRDPQPGPILQPCHLPENTLHLSNHPHDLLTAHHHWEPGSCRAQFHIQHHLLRSQLADMAKEKYQGIQGDLLRRKAQLLDLNQIGQPL